MEFGRKELFRTVPEGRVCGILSDDRCRWSKDDVLILRMDGIWQGVSWILFRRRGEGRVGEGAVLFPRCPADVNEWGAVRNDMRNN